MVVLALALAVWMGVAMQALAQDKPKSGEPFVTVYFGGYDALSQAISLVGKLAGKPELAEMLEMPLQMIGGEEALGALDKSKPWGMTVATGAQPMDVVVRGFLPVKDVKVLVKALKKADIEAKEDGGVFALETPGGEVFVKQAEGGWAVISNKKESLANIPADPAKQFGGANEKYLLAVSLAVKNIPEETRQMVMVPLTFALEMAKQQRQPGESDEQAALRSKMIDQSIKQINTMLKELDAIRFGLNVDRQTSTAYLDYVLTALPGTQLAKQLGQAGELKSGFAGLIAPDATVSFRFTGKMQPDEIAQVKPLVASVRTNALGELEKQSLNEEQLKQAKQVIGDLMDVIEKTVDAGMVDAAAALRLEAKKSLLVAGGRIAEGDKLDAALKRLIEAAGKDEPDMAKAIKLNAEEYGGVKFHVLSLPTAALGEGAKEAEVLFGDKVTAILGIGSDSLYLAVGNDPAGELKRAIDQGKAQAGKTVPPMEVAVALTPILRLVSAVGGGEPKSFAQAGLKLLEGASAGKDHVRLSAKVIENGTQVRLEVEEGLLKVLGSLPAMAGAQ
jgi:hypothetical protein